MGLFGIFSYFAKIDKDGSGYLELNEIEGKKDNHKTIKTSSKWQFDQIKAISTKIFDPFLHSCPQKIKINALNFKKKASSFNFKILLEKFSAQKKNKK